ncbi:MAG: hypothetical protein V4490_01635 [Pseudomonadota bacterium]
MQQQAQQSLTFNSLETYVAQLRDIDSRFSIVDKGAELFIVPKIMAYANLFRHFTDMLNVDLSKLSVQPDDRCLLLQIISKFRDRLHAFNEHPVSKANLGVKYFLTAVEAVLPNMELYVNSYTNGQLHEVGKKFQRCEFYNSETLEGNFVGISRHYRELEENVKVFLKSKTNDSTAQQCHTYLAELSKHEKSVRYYVELDQKIPGHVFGAHANKHLEVILKLKAALIEISKALVEKPVPVDVSERTACFQSSAALNANSDDFVYVEARECRQPYDEQSQSYSSSVLPMFDSFMRFAFGTLTSSSKSSDMSSSGGSREYRPKGK